MQALAIQLKRWPSQQPFMFLALAAVLWFALYQTLIPVSEALVAALPVERDSHLGGALQFFFYDTPKVLLLLTGIVFLMGIVHTFVSPERTRALLSGKRLGVGNVMAASLGIVTPFCSCSAVPLFIGFLQAGVPLGITFSFLISAPMVNEVALALLFGMFGWKVAALYLVMGLLVAIVAGLVIGKLGMEHHLEDWVRAMQNSQPVSGVDIPALSWGERIDSGFSHVHEIVGKVWPYILAGIALGAGIHGYVPEDFMASIMGKDAPWWSVPAAVAHRCADVHQRRRHHPDRRGADGQGRGTRHGAGLHDERDRAVGPRDHHPAQGAEAATDRDFRRGRVGRYPAGGLCVQHAALREESGQGHCGFLPSLCRRRALMADYA